MERATEQKIILITQKTRLEQLIYRYNTPGQVKFYLEHHGGDFSDYENEHNAYQNALAVTARTLESCGRLQILEREHVPNYLFGADDLVIALGRDGLVVNVLKYLTTQKLIGVNPEPSRWDGTLLPFTPGELKRIVPAVLNGQRGVKSITLAQAVLHDGQTLFGVNDLFIGQKTHASARYEIQLDGRKEVQSSSGVICSTGLGATGWLKGILAGAAGIDRYYGIQSRLTIPENFTSSTESLFFTVREPFPSRSTGAEIVFGQVSRTTPLQITSLMPENGVIFSDGVESDFLEFNSGASVTITLADRKGQLII